MRVLREREIKVIEIVRNFQRTEKHNRGSGRGRGSGDEAEWLGTEAKVGLAGLVSAFLVKGKLLGWSGHVKSCWE